MKILMIAILFNLSTQAIAREMFFGCSSGGSNAFLFSIDEEIETLTILTYRIDKVRKFALVGQDETSHIFRNEDYLEHPRGGDPVEFRVNSDLILNGPTWRRKLVEVDETVWRRRDTQTGEYRAVQLYTRKLDCYHQEPVRGHGYP